MRYGSVCSGIEAASVAWRGLGWDCSFLSEIEKFPRAVLAHHYPTRPLHGDFTTIKAGDYEPIDLLVGGTPCQSFSIAGLRGGMDDERGNLALEFLRLASRLRPKWILWENVPGVLSSNKGRDFGAFLGGLGECGYGFAYRVLDAQFFGLAQRRKRVFVVGYLGDWRPAGAVLFERESLRRDSPPRRKERKDVAPTISARTTGGGGLGSDFDMDGGLVQTAIHAIQERAVCENPNARPDGMGVRSDGLAYTLEARQTVQAIAFGGNRTSGPLDVATACNAHAGPHGRLDFETETFITHALTGEGFDASKDGTGRGTPLVPTLTSNGDAHGGFRDEHGLVQSRASVRRLTPRECERLQGFPDDYTAIPFRGKLAADGPRYKALGNSMAVPVMRKIGERINLINAMFNDR